MFQNLYRTQFLRDGNRNTKFTKEGFALLKAPKEVMDMAKRDLAAADYTTLPYGNVKVSHRNKKNMKLS